MTTNRLTRTNVRSLSRRSRACCKGLATSNNIKLKGEGERWGNSLDRIRISKCLIINRSMYFSCTYLNLKLRFLKVFWLIYSWFVVGFCNILEDILYPKELMNNFTGLNKVMMSRYVIWLDILFIGNLDFVNR